MGAPAELPARTRRLRDRGNALEGSGGRLPAQRPERPHRRRARDHARHLRPVRRGGQSGRLRALLLGGGLRGRAAGRGLRPALRQRKDDAPAGRALLPADDGLRPQHDSAGADQPRRSARLRRARAGAAPGRVPRLLAAVGPGAAGSDRRAVLPCRLQQQRATRLHRDDPPVAAPVRALRLAQARRQGRPPAALPHQRRLSQRLRLGHQRQQRLVRARAPRSLPHRLRGDLAAGVCRAAGAASPRNTLPGDAMPKCPVHAVLFVAALSACGDSMAPIEYANPLDLSGAWHVADSTVYDITNVSEGADGLRHIGAYAVTGSAQLTRLGETSYAANLEVVITWIDSVPGSAARRTPQSVAFVNP